MGKYKKNQSKIVNWLNFSTKKGTMSFSGRLNFLIVIIPNLHLSCPGHNIIKLLNLYTIFFVPTCITLLSSIYPLPAIHSLLVTLYVRNILLVVKFLKQAKLPTKGKFTPLYENEQFESKIIQWRLLKGNDTST